MNEITMFVGKNKTVKVDLDNLLANVTVIETVSYDVAKKYKNFISALEVCVESYGYNVNIIDNGSYTMAVSNLNNIVKRINNDITKIAVEVSKNEGSIMTDNMSAAAEEAEVKETNNKEEKVMGTVKENMNAAVEEMVGKFTAAKENIRVNAGETKEEYFDKVDDSLNVMKGAFGDILGILDGVLGYTVLKNSILDIIKSGSNGNTSKKGLFKMAKRCRELIEEEIENLEFWGDSESLKKATQLKALTEGVRGKSIFEAFVSGCIWVGKKVARKLRAWFHVDDKKSVIGSIFRSISGFIDVLRAGVKLVWNTVKFGVSFMIAGAIKVLDSVFRAIKTFISGIKEFVVDKYNKLIKKDAEEDIDDDEEFGDDFFNEEDIDDEE